MIKVQKLVTGAMNLETHIRKCHGKTHDGGSTVTPLHEAIDDRCWQWWLEESRSPKQASEACDQSPFSIKSWLFQ